MPDDTTDLDIALRRNDYDQENTQEFNLKANKVDRSLGNNIVTKGILSAVGDLAGKNVNLGFEKVSLNGVIKATQEGTYPEGGNYPSIDTSQWERATEKEMAMAHATRTWGPDASNGFDTLIWGPRTLGVMISKYNSTENRDKDGPEQYTYSVELTHADVYVGDD